MGDITQHKPVLLIAAVTSRHDAAFEWAAARASASWGPIVKRSVLFEFTETNYYQATMGDGLKKQFLAFENLFAPAHIADTKHRSNTWEQEFRSEHDFSEERPINIDPGYISEAKLVLVTTKDRDHRIYLRDGIFAEVTLHFRGREWTHSRWTYPDYQRHDFQDFFTECRQWLRERMRRSAAE
jgi:hypothetical protein